jgi:hypothetical protein
MQRLVDQAVRNRPNIADPIRVQILIRFQIPISKLSRQSHSPPTVPSVIGGQDDDGSDRRGSQANLSGTRSSVAPQESSTSVGEPNVMNPPLRFTDHPVLDDIEEDVPATPTEQNTPAGANLRFARRCPRAYGQSFPTSF